MQNGTLIQYFHWYIASDVTLWSELAGRAEELANAGFTAVWMPPAYKGASGPNSVGYDVYDLFDLGEFDQKNAVRTKYGTKAQLLAAINRLQQSGLQVYADVVFNHKDGADETETVLAQEVDWEDRNLSRSDWYEIDAWTKFTFAGRGDMHSSMKWFWWCFDALSYNERTKDRSKLYRLKDKSFSTGVSHEHTNYDYLMADDLDMGVEFVRGELRYWGEWLLQQTGVDGFRIDACKHIRSAFFPDWLAHLRAMFSKELFSVGEYWSGEVSELIDYLAATGGVMSLFDVPLHYKFSQASRMNGDFDMRTILDGTLVQAAPLQAVTFVDNHDTQPCQSLESPVEPWFKPLAYALILLRREGYPCVFYGDYYGAQYDNCRPGEPPVVLYSHRFLIDKFLWARRAYGFGEQLDYFDDRETVGWTRLGNAEHPGAMAVILSDGAGEGSKWMNVARPNAWFADLTGHLPERIQANADGWANFRCKARSVSVWLQA